ncbi:MAG: SDR family NAD(P)-dependent oxidoreductase [Bacteroidales bacterium]|nr:SDR family NAD(P)-dependent oxidoreductase [Bacteroidales bacterium]
MNILITGTNSGIGNAVAREYLEKGARVYGISRRFNKNLRKYADYIHLSHDLSDHTMLEDKLTRLLEGEAVLDKVILNAGMLTDINDIRDTSLEAIHRVMDVNVWVNKVLLDALFRLVPEIRQVVAISSGASRSGSRGWNVYAISKAALNMLIMLYSREIPDTHFSAIAPGVVDTGMQDYIFTLPDNGRFQVVSRLKEMKRNRRMKDPREAAVQLIEAMGYVLEQESGSYIDIREL